MFRWKKIGRSRLLFSRPSNAAAACPARWEEMEGDEKVRFCAACRLSIYNLRAMDPEEAAARMSQDSGGESFHFYRRPDGTFLVRECPVSRELGRHRRRGFLIATAAGLLAMGALARIHVPGGLASFRTGKTSEAHLPELFRARDFTCATLCEAANHYVALGEDRAVKDLSTLVGGWDGARFSLSERIGWLCRILFEPTGKEPLRPPGLGGLSLPPMRLEDWPLYPVALSGSTYVVLSEGYSLAGQAEPIQSYIEYCRGNGRFRTAPIPTPARARALTDLDRFHRSAAWKALRWEDSGENYHYSIDEGWVWEGIRRQAEALPWWTGALG